MTLRKTHSDGCSIVSNNPSHGGSRYFPECIIGELTVGGAVAMAASARILLCFGSDQLNLGRAPTLPIPIHPAGPMDKAPNAKSSRPFLRARTPREPP